MVLPRLFLASILLLAFLGIVSADYKKGRSLKPYAAPGSGPKYHDNSVATKVQGLVYCKDGKLTPMKGATARVTCLALNDHGYESAPFSVVTPPSDENGYFHINLSKYVLKSFVLADCRVFLEAPAPGACSVPTDTNDGLSGAVLAKYRALAGQSSLYSVGPFVFVPSQY